MPTRDVFITEQLAAVTAVASGVNVLATLSFTNKPSAKYLAGASWDCAVSGGGWGLGSVWYMEAAATATCVDALAPASRDNDPRQKQSFFGFRRITTPASAGTQNVQFRARLDRQGGAGFQANWGQIRLFAIKTTAADAYGEFYNATRTTSGVWDTFCSASITPASARRYALLAYSGWQSSSSGIRRGGIRLEHQATAMGHTGFQEMSGHPSTGDSFAAGTHPCTFFDAFTLGGGANKFTLAINTSAAEAISTKQGAIALLAESAFGGFGVAVAATDVTAVTSSSTLVTAQALVTGMTGGKRYGVFGRSSGDLGGFASSQFANIVINAVTATENQMQNSAGSAADQGRYLWRTYSAFALVTASTGNSEIYLTYGSEVGGVAAHIAYQRILIMQFDGTAAVPGGGGFKPFWLKHHFNQITGS